MGPTCYFYYAAMVDPLPIVHPLPMVVCLPMVNPILIMDTISIVHIYIVDLTRYTPNSLCHCLRRRSIKPFPLVPRINITLSLR